MPNGRDASCSAATAACSCEKPSPTDTVLRSLDSFEQLSEVIRRFDLSKRIVPFHRCLRCNHPLEPIAKEAVLDRLEPLTKLYFDEFQICPACKQIYWKGSHFEKMQGLIEQLTGPLG